MSDNFVCSGCFKTKPISEGRARKGRPMKRCKACRNGVEASSYAANPEKFKRRKKKWRTSQWLRASLSSSRGNAMKKAEKKGIPFSVTSEFLFQLAEDCNGICCLSGLPFQRAIAPGRKHPLSPSIDRIKPELGYVPGNLRIICDALNSAKGCGTDEDLIAICRAVVERNPL